MSVSAARQQTSAAQLAQALGMARDRPVADINQTEVQQRTPLIHSGDPRSLVELSEALSSFLTQLNGRAEGALPVQTAANVQAVKDDGVGDGLKELKGNFEGLVGGLESAHADRMANKPADERAMSRLKSFVEDFVRNLQTLAKKITDAPPPSGAAPQPAADVAAKIAAPPVAKPAPQDKHAARSSLFAALGEKLQRHFDEL